MKILIIGLENASAEILLGDERLVNIRRLMELGCYGRLESVIPAGSILGWLCLAASQDPGSLGIYGLRNRVKYSYENLNEVDSTAIHETTIWDQIGSEGGRSILIGGPPYSNVEANERLVVDNSFTNLIIERTGDMLEFKKQVFELSRSQFNRLAVVLQEQEWQYLHFVDTGLSQVQNVFWSSFDPALPCFEPNNPFQNVIPEYYRHLDDQIGGLLELIDDDTVVLICSVNGVQHPKGAFCINEWLVSQDLLVLNKVPDHYTPFNRLNVNWGKTRVWSDDGDCAHIYLNIKGRESRGVIEISEVLAFREELKIALERLTDNQGRPMGNRVYKPEEIYKNIHCTAPDLIAYIGGLSWSVIGGVGHQCLFLQDAKAGQETCNVAPEGVFALASANNPLQGEFLGAHLLDIAPTLLELGGYEIPNSMQGHSLASSVQRGNAGDDLSRDEKAILRERLSGLGYIS